MEQTPGLMATASQCATAPATLTAARQPAMNETRKKPAFLARLKLSELSTNTAAPANAPSTTAASMPGASARPATVASVALVAVLLTGSAMVLVP
ncbi:Uncharacterised protein [Chromobacterium vaccinii]|nr:Uncharacterised protein [Chromobacterium vaccinii]